MGAGGEDPRPRKGYGGWQDADLTGEVGGQAPCPARHLRMSRRSSADAHNGCRGSGKPWWIVENSSKLAPEDEAAIRALLDCMGQAWARGDGDAYASVFSEDATYDNAPGERVVGRQEIAASHQRIFHSVLRHTRLGSGYPVRLQPITPDVVLVHASGAVLFAGEDEAKVPPNGLLTEGVGDAWCVGT
jgi:uncharacterized protein (TIGR02246 family)